MGAKSETVDVGLDENLPGFEAKVTSEVKILRTQEKFLDLP